MQDLFREVEVHRVFLHMYHRSGGDSYGRFRTTLLQDAVMLIENTEPIGPHVFAAINAQGSGHGRAKGCSGREQNSQ